MYDLLAVELSVDHRSPYRWHNLHYSYIDMQMGINPSMMRTYVSINSPSAQLYSSFQAHLGRVRLLQRNI